MTHILFITTHNLATNPRLVKEISLAVDNHFKVTVICFQFNNWSFPNNIKLLESFRDVKFVIIPAGRRPLLPWLRSAFLEKFYRKLCSLFSLSIGMRANAISRRNLLIIKALKKVEKPDWVIGHNPGALYATYYAAKQFGCHSGFDVEDYHPGETNHNVVQELTRQLMQQLLPSFDYVSFASAPIRKQCVIADGITPLKYSLLIHNAFPQQEFSAVGPIQHGKMKLVWFSQHISFNRGIEHIISIVAAHADKMELHLYGHVDAIFQEQYFPESEAIVLHGVVTQQQLHHELVAYDIGLALEPGKDLNNELAVSNKMMAYLQSGLFILATDTIGQFSFLKDLSNAGIVIKKDFSNVRERLFDLAEEINQIRSERKKRMESMLPFSWDHASLPLLHEWSREKHRN